MNIPARQIRAVVQHIPGLRPILSPRQQRARELILKAALEVFTQLGRAHLTMRALAAGIWISRDRIQTHFLDIDSLLAEMLLIHLQGISRALGNTPNTPAERRAAYYAYTRGPFGCLTKEHAVFVLQRRHLPEDLLPDIDLIHRNLGPNLNPENPDRTLELLDDSRHDLAEIEAILNHESTAPQPNPAFELATVTDDELAALCADSERREDEYPEIECLENKWLEAKPPEPEQHAPPAPEIRNLETPHLDAGHLEIRDFDAGHRETAHPKTGHFETQHLETRPLETHHVETSDLETSKPETQHPETWHLETHHFKTHYLETSHLEAQHLEARHHETRHLETHHLESGHLKPGPLEPEYPSTAHPQDQPQTPPRNTLPKPGIRTLASPVRPPFARPPKPPRTMASLLTPIEHLSGKPAIFSNPRAASRAA